MTAFTFTENADPETFRAEAEAYLERVEIPEPLQKIIDHYREAATATESIVQQYRQVGDIEAVSKLSQAFNALVDYKQEPETGFFVPDTEPLRQLLESEFKHEATQLVVDLNAAPSEKYQGYTRFQEFIRDGFGLNDTQMTSLDEFLQTGGRWSTPRFVPDGVDPKAAEAYWKYPERTALQQEIETRVETLRNEFATETEKAVARQELATMNARLLQIQQGYDAADRMKAEEARNRQGFEAQRAKAVEQEFLTAVNGIANQISQQIAKALTFVDGPAAGVVADGIVSLVRNAYSPEPFEADHAKNALKERGIVHDWSKGRALLDRLFAAQDKASRQMANPATNPRAVEITKQQIAATMREIQAEHKEIIGKITRSVAGGASKALKTKIEAAPKVQAVRAKVAGGGSPGGPELDKMSLADLRKNLSQGDRALRGDLGGF